MQPPFRNPLHGLPLARELTDKEHRVCEQIGEYLLDKFNSGLIQSFTFEIVNYTGFTNIHTFVGNFYEVLWPEIRMITLKQRMNPVYRHEHYAFGGKIPEGGRALKQVPFLLQGGETLATRIWIEPKSVWLERMRSNLERGFY